MLNKSKTIDITTISKSSMRQSLLPWNSMHISYENSMIISSIKKKAKQKLRKKLLLNKIILGFLYLILIIAHAFLAINLILLLLSSSPSSSSEYSFIFLFSFFGLLSSLLLLLSLFLLLISLLLLLPSLLRPSLYFLSSSLSSLLACLFTFVLAQEENVSSVWKWFGSFGGITLAMGITIWRIGNVLMIWEEFNEKNKSNSIRKKLSY